MSSKAVKQAHFEAWIDSASVLDEYDREKQIDSFATRWGSLEAEAFKRALQHGNEHERVFALFALGHLAPSGGERLLRPFLTSSFRKERWASTISLGRYRDTQAFLLLLELLTEKLEYCLPSLVACRWPVDPLLLEVWERKFDRQDTKYVLEFDWCLLHRLSITLLLGAWGDSRAIPVLIQALRRSFELEFGSTYPNSLNAFAQTWHHFQDRLAYVLGQLGAWNALDTLDLPLKRLHIARRYLVFGSLRASVSQVFGFLYLANWGKDGNDISSLLGGPGVDLTLGLPELEVVDEIVRKQLYSSQNEQLPSFHDFLIWHSERDDEWYDRWEAERKRVNRVDQPEPFDNFFLPEDDFPLP